MKTRIVLSAALLGIAGVATADNHDLDGFFAGGHLSRVQASMTQEDVDCYFNCSSYTQVEDDYGFGLQAGYNHVRDNLLLGVSLNYTDAGVEEEFQHGFTTGPADDMVSRSELETLLSLQFRAGLVVGKTALVLSTGPAEGDFNHEFRDQDGSLNDTSDDFVAKYSDTSSGWVTGVSLEHLFADSIVGGISYSEYTFDDEVEPVLDVNGSPPGQADRVKFTDTVDTLNIFVNYKF